MVAVIVVMLPLAAPKIAGIKAYGVLTGSMEPTYPVGGVVYVRPCYAAQVNIGDAITFTLGTDTDYVMTHRVVEATADTFITQGDANNTVDPNPVMKSNLIGRVVFYLPYMARVSMFIETGTGKATMIILFAAAFVLWMLGDILSHLPERESKPAKARVTDSRFNPATIGGVVLILGALVYLGVWFVGGMKTNKVYDTVSESMDTMTADSAPDDDLAGLTEEDKAFITNLRELADKYPDVVGWIKFDDLDIDYPIMQGGTDFEYLHTDYTGESAQAGSIFLESNNTPDMSDAHSIIYGHNMRNGSMFGRLKNYKKDGVFEQNRSFRIYTLDTVYRYDVFAYYDIPAESSLYNVDYTHGASFANFVNDMIVRSVKETGIKPTGDDDIVTLSTCSAKGYRFVVHGVKSE